MKKVISFYNPEQHHRSLVLLRGVDVGLSAMAYDACCLWCLGYPDQALKKSQETLDLTYGFGHPFTLVDTLCFAGCMLHEMRRDAKALLHAAEEMFRITNENDLPGWSSHSTRYIGVALAMEGQPEEGIDQIREGIAIGERTGELLYKPITLCSLAVAQENLDQIPEAMATIEEALKMTEQTDERHWEAEIHRVRAKLLASQGDDAGAETSFNRAIEVSRAQQAKSWELRASLDLARLWQKQGKTSQAREMLSEIFGWFTEGFETSDLQEAKVLLDELS